MGAKQWAQRLVIALVLAVAAGVAGICIYETFINDFSSLNHYETLGVPRNAAPADIKRAFRDLSLRYHPDKATYNAELQVRRFHQISDANTVLMNDESRRQYDQQLYEQELRARMMGRLPGWRFTPLTWETEDVLLFYLQELPLRVAMWLSAWLSVDGLLTCLVFLGCVVFVLEVIQRLLRRISDFFTFRRSKQDMIDREEAMRAARARQQEKLQAASEEAKVRRRQVRGRAAQ
ncbi:TPA: hypothetical protein N0F65_012036 [Lagenidium giganteum]|uniref:J domain-containing protein n=1 Tax=Lagenidium giganteum TaxID=4803 RepID=A0AAV2YT14_9STRA|nr:TPA: hypothetical protein N0F65_012036 [Lagenidium giganteum]